MMQPNLIIHHVRRQTTIHKEDKAKIKQLVRQFIPDLFFHRRMDLSDDENVDDEMDDDSEEKLEPKNTSPSTSKMGNFEPTSKEPSSKASITPTSGSNTTTTTFAPSSSSLSTSPPSGGVCTSNNSDGFSSPNNSSSMAAKRKTPSDSEKLVASVKSEPGVSGSCCGSGGGPGGGGGDPQTVPIKVEIKSEPLDDSKPSTFSVATSSLADDEYRLFFGNNNWYLFFRLHHLLCQRLSEMYGHATRIAAEELKEKKERRDSTAIALRLKPKNEIAVEDYYPALLDMIQNMLDGNMESTTFEDTLREMFGIQAYVAFTLDKVVNGAVRQLQHIVCDDMPSQCTSLFISEAKKGGSGGPIASAHRRLHHEQMYQKKVEKLLQDENCFKLFSYKRETRITVELIDTDMEESEEQNNGGTSSSSSGNANSVGITSAGGNGVSCNSGNAHATSRGGSEKDSEMEYPYSSSSPFVHSVIPPAVAEVERWSEYVEKYVNSVAPQVSPAMQAQLRRKPVFLPRNLRAWRREATNKHSSNSYGQGERNAGKEKGNSHGMEIVDKTQCKFNLSNFKMVFVVNSDSYMYKKEALRRAKQSHETVSKRMRKGFDSWLEKWARHHVTEAEKTYAAKWFMGEVDGLRPNKTRVRKIETLGQPPYLPFNKYVCDLNSASSLSSTHHLHHHHEAS
ncbi:Paired amphipathic helix protein Sin3a [Armadillidium vulgare]|nr:Paired amphipathic helix protein Sin3a [Armadillidium vulgare]